MDARLSRAMVTAMAAVPAGTVTAIRASFQYVAAEWQ